MVQKKKSVWHRGQHKNCATCTAVRAANRVNATETLERLSRTKAGRTRLRGMLKRMRKKK